MKRQALPSHGLLSAYDKQFKVADKRHANTPLPPPTLTTNTVAAVQERFQSEVL